MRLDDPSATRAVVKLGLKAHTDTAVQAPTSTLRLFNLTQALLEEGGDSAAGVIAHERSWLGADTFTSFDKRVVKPMEARGQAVRLLV